MTVNDKVTNHEDLVLMGRSNQNRSDFSKPRKHLKQTDRQAHIQRDKRQAGGKDTYVSTEVTL